MPSKKHKGHWPRGKPRHPWQGVQRVRRRISRSVAFRRGTNVALPNGTIAGLARELRVSAKTIWRWRHVDRPSPENIARIHAALDRLGAPAHK